MHRVVYCTLGVETTLKEPANNVDSKVFTPSLKWGSILAPQVHQPDALDRSPTMPPPSFEKSSTLKETENAICIKNLKLYTKVYMFSDQIFQELKRSTVVLHINPISSHTYSKGKVIEQLKKARWKFYSC